MRDLYQEERAAVGLAGALFARVSERITGPVYWADSISDFLLRGADVQLRWSLFGKPNSVAMFLPKVVYSFDDLEGHFVSDLTGSIPIIVDDSRSISVGCGGDWKRVKDYISESDLRKHSGKRFQDARICFSPGSDEFKLDSITELS